MKIGLTAAFFVVLGIGYWIGQRTSEADNEFAPRGQSLEELQESIEEFQQQDQIGQQVAAIRNRIETVKTNLALDEDAIETESAELSRELEQLNNDMLEMKMKGIDTGVPIPADSPSGKIRDQERTASGIPVSVLEQYEKDTGVSPSEIEKLMKQE